MTVSNDAAYINGSNVSITASMSDADTGVYGQSVDPGTGTFGAWSAYSSNQYIGLPHPTASRPFACSTRTMQATHDEDRHSHSRHRRTGHQLGATNGASYYGNQSFIRPLPMRCRE